MPFALSIGLAVALSACTNNLLKSASQALNTGTGVGAPTPFVGVGTEGNSSPITLTRVVRDNTDPTGTLDLFDDGSGSIGQNCTSQDGGGGGQPSAFGATTCACSYSYTLPDGTSQSFDAQSTYHEQDQLRCSYANVPQGVSSLTVSIHLLSADITSNSVTFNFTGGGVSLDLSNPNSFTPVQRFQCRDLLKVAYLFDSHVYDPVVSEDPRYTYPLDFYTTNFGGTLAYYADAANNISFWNCPSLQTDPTLNFTLYSVAPDSTGNKQIFPPPGNGVFDRYNFTLAKQPSGVFQQEVDAMGVPGGIAAGTGALPALGYGAAPIPSANGETCPDSSVTIPAGYHWVKVWLFRADLPPRKYPTSTKLKGLNKVACNPGLWNDGDLPTSAVPKPPYGLGPYPDCIEDQDPARISPRPSSTDGSTIADRFSTGSAMCFKVTPGNAPTVAAGGNPATTDDIAPGTDTWDAPKSSPLNGTGIGYDPEFGCGKNQNPSPAFPLDVVQSCDGTMSKSGSHLPIDNSSPPALGDIDNVGQNGPRFDFLFVVSPPSVMAADMMNSATSVHLVYTPYRFMSAGDCKSSDPDNPQSLGDCNPGRAIRNYALKLHDVGSNGDPPADDPNRAGVFPVCALQRD